MDKVKSIFSEIELVWIGKTHEQLARYPQDYIAKKVKFTGKVIQIMDSSDKVQIRLAVDSDWDQVLLAYYDPSIVNKKVLEEGIITIYGLS